MLKHCSPSSVDLKRRSRRNLTDLDTTTTTLIVPIDLTFDEDISTVEDVSTNVECCSEKSYSTVSSVNDHFYENLISPLSSKKFSPNKRLTSPVSNYRVVSPLTSGSTTTVLIRHDPPDLNLSGHSQLQLQHQQQHRLRIEEPRIPIKVYASCLRSDIEYKTLSVTYKTTSKELIWMLLSKYKMRHRDPKLFYLTMDINIKRTGIPLRRTLSLDDESRPAELKSCHPWGECKFTLQMRKGGIVRIHDSVLMAESKYKCLLISDQTTVIEVIKILFHCYDLQDVAKEDKFCLYEVSGNESERRLHPEEQPVQVQSQWPSSTQCRFVLRPAPARSKKSERNKKVRQKCSTRKSVLSLSSEDLNESLDEDEGNGADVEDVEKRSKVRQKSSKIGSVVSLCSDAEEVEEVVTGVDHDDGGHFVNGELDMSYSSAESEASSEFSALRFRDSPISNSSRSSASTDSGLLLKSSSPDSLPPFLKRHHNKLKKQLETTSNCNNNSKNNNNNATFHICRPRQQQQQQLNRHFSLHSLLETLPAASVDTGTFDVKRASLSSLSSHSRTSDFDGFFYI